MPKNEAYNVLIAIEKAIADVAEMLVPEPPTDADRRNLWTHDCDDTLCPENEPYCTLRIVTPAPAWNEPNRVAAQAYTIGPQPFVALEFAARVSDAMLDGADGDEDRLPRHEWTVTHEGQSWIVDIFDLREPMITGRNDQGWSEVSGNFEFAYRRIAS